LTYTSTPRRIRRRLGVALGLASATALLGLPGPAIAGSGGIGVGGDDDSTPTTTQTTTGTRAKLQDGLAIPPAGAPRRVVRAIEAANSIEDKPYEYGGGHAKWIDDGYDCSGAVSYALGKYGARVLDAPMPSGSFSRWGEPGPGRWITTYSNGGHMYAVIAGLRWDTSQTAGNGPGWSRTNLRQAGYTVRHPAGL
jgi:cell wall-associated NlpC family hydrolase